MQIKYKLNRVVHKLLAMIEASAHARRLYQGTASKSMYVKFLIQSYHYVRHTDTLLARAAERLVSLGQHPDLAYLCARKATEEHGHADWILSDLSALGVSREVVVRVPPTRPVNIYVHWNTLMVETVPVAFLGTAYVLECLSIHRADETARNLVERSGIPNIQRAVSFIRGHAEADWDHVAALSGALQQVSEPHERELILLTADVTRLAYVNLLTATSQGKT